ncbi:calcium/sodium antiporter [Flammeovirgaceae bacterium SG7u.111]|nr:calcium/sodium antiporter [Flammeovirgaceae bacterium SG7u.132]WPO37991.1 calcium/sodium antiporter [Flammeovirgaceae bacterium SG7u.111]
MDIYLDILVIIICIIALAKGSTWMVDSSIRIANTFRVPELVIGLTIVAFGTSAPEFGVTILAAMRGMSDIAIGNVVGSNIFNLGFILGGTALFGALNSSKSLVYRDGMFLFFGSALLTVFLWDLSMSKLEGIILFVLLFVYLGFLFIKKEPMEKIELKEKARKLDYLLMPLGLGLILGGSHFLVDSAVNVARAFGMSEWVIGATIVAFGTSAPELATSITASFKGHHGLSIGNLIGSDIFNIFGVLGVAGILQNMEVDPEVTSNLYLLMGMIVLTLFFLRTNWKLARWEGAVLLLIGAIRWYFSFTAG